MATRRIEGQPSRRIILFSGLAFGASILGIHRIPLPTHGTISPEPIPQQPQFTVQDTTFRTGNYVGNMDERVARMLIETRVELARKYFARHYKFYPKGIVYTALSPLPMPTEKKVPGELKSVALGRLTVLTPGSSRMSLEYKSLQGGVNASFQTDGQQIIVQGLKAWEAWWGLQKLIDSEGKPNTNRHTIHLSSPFKLA